MIKKLKLKNMAYYLRITKIISMFLFILIFVLSCKNKKEQVGESIRYVKIEDVSSLRLNGKLHFNGTIKEQNNTVLSFRVGGPLNEFDKDIGSYVKKNELIAAIDKRDFIVQLNAAEARLKHAKGEYERYLGLYNKKKLPENSLEKLETNYLMAKSAFEKAENALIDSELKAPFTGYVFKKFTENYNTVAPGQPIISLVDISKQELVIYAPASMLNDIREMNSGFCAVNDAGEKDLKASLLRVSQKAGKDNLYEIRYQLYLNDSTRVKPGMSAELILVNESDMGKVIIPSKAIFHLGGNDFVWVYDQNTSVVKKRRISCHELENNGFISILSGLALGEKVVSAGTHTLYEGQKVKPIRRNSKTNKGGLL